MNVTFTVLGETFEWDEGKAAINVQKHGVSFMEATESFFDPCTTLVIRHRKMMRTGSS